MKKTANILFLSSIFLIILLSTILLSSSVLFILNIDIVSFFAFISIFFSFIVYYFVMTRNNIFSIKQIILGNILGIILVVIAIILSEQFYDFAWDSNWYHKTALGCLKLGWNPLYQNFYDFVQKTDMSVECLKSAEVWAQHYCKASWIVGANIYALTGNVETAKSVNLLMAFILFGIAYHYLYSTRFTSIQAFIIAILLVFNPITCSQIFTLYVDNLLMTNLFAIIIVLIGISDIKYRLNSFYKYFLLALLVIFCINIKFTGLAYAGIFCLLFFCIWCMRAKIERKLVMVFTKNIIFYFVVCSIAVFIVGASSYLTNFIHEGHPLYPLAGDGKIDIMTFNEPDIFKEKTTLEKLFISVFGETSNYLGYTFEEPKTLFSVSQDEITNCGYDTRIGGFGPLFGGILVVSLIVFSIALIILFRINKYWFIIMLSTFLTIFLMLSLITESWWARYSPHLYIIPILSIALLFIGYNKTIKLGKAGCFFVSIFLVISMILNASYFTKYLIDCNAKTNIVKEELKELAESTVAKKIYITYTNGTLAGIEFNLRDYAVNYQVVEEIQNVGERVYGGLINIEN